MALLFKVLLNHSSKREFFPLSKLCDGHKILIIFGKSLQLFSEHLRTQKIIQDNRPLSYINLVDIPLLTKGNIQAGMPCSLPANNSMLCHKNANQVIFS